MVYVDTSIIVKLYFKEKYSRTAAAWLKANDEAIPLTSFHELEFINAINLKVFRNEAKTEIIHQLKRKLEEHQTKGIFYRPPLEWSDVFLRAVELSEKHSARQGSRALDILHVAAALTLQADPFLTLDNRQSGLAVRAGLTIVDIRRSEGRAKT